MKTCNRYGIPIWVSSTGRNIAYGGMAPAHRGTVIVSLRRKDSAEARRARECYLNLVKEFAAGGYGVYRTSIAFMDEVGATYGATTQSVFRKIKKALDPKGIIAPGKSGIEIAIEDPE